MGEEKEKKIVKKEKKIKKEKKEVKKEKKIKTEIKKPVKEEHIIKPKAPISEKSSDIFIRNFNTLSINYVINKPIKTNKEGKVDINDLDRSLGKFMKKNKNILNKKKNKNCEDKVFRLKIKSKKKTPKKIDVSKKKNKNTEDDKEKK